MAPRLRPAATLAAGIIISIHCISATAAQQLPDGFVYLSEIETDIAQDIRYAGKDNFTGAPVPGYRSGECLLVRPVALALAKVHKRLRKAGYGLLVYDCYRPAKAVRRFAEWAKEPGGTDPKHYPAIARSQLFAKGYIARKSGHSSGGTVDLTLTRDGKPVEMGTAFDLFDPLAHTANPKISPEARANRRRLMEAMAAAGFNNYKREWWHFRYAAEPYAGRSFDFDIMPRTP